MLRSPECSRDRAAVEQHLRRSVGADAIVNLVGTGGHLLFWCERLFASDIFFQIQIWLDAPRGFACGSCATSRLFIYCKCCFGLFFAVLCFYLRASFLSAMCPGS